MRAFSRVLSIGLVLSGLVVPSFVMGQPQQSENFRITKSVLDAGGGASSSENFELYSAFGQPTPIGVQSSENFVLYAGYLTPTLGPGSLNPIDDLVVQRVAYPATDVRLNWGSIPAATQYKVYRSNDPNFIPDIGNYLATESDTFYVDLNVLSGPETKYYYIVTALDAAGLVLTPVLAPQQPTHIAVQPNPGAGGVNQLDQPERPSPGVSPNQNTGTKSGRSKSLR